MSIFSTPEQQEFKIVFGDVADPTMRAYDEQLLSMIRQRYTHEQIMSGDFLFPIGKTFGDALHDAGVAIGKIVKAAAPFVAMIPGYGTVVGAAMYSVGSVAAGDRLDQAAFNTIEQLLPANVKGTYRSAVDLGYALGRGQRVDGIALNLARKEAAERGGPQATAAFDAGLALGQGKGLQDAGFQLLGNWAKGATNDQRAAAFMLDLGLAAANGKPIKQFLLDEAKAQFFAAVPAAQQAYVLKKAIDYFLAHPTEVVDPDTADLAERVGVPIEAIRAALICIKEMADGTITIEEGNLEQFNQWDTLYTYSASDHGDANTIAYAFNLADTPGNRARNNDLALKGAAIAQTTPAVAQLRSTNTNAMWRRGFDIGTYVSHGHTESGPGQDAVKNSLSNADEQVGFLAARNQQYQLAKGVPVSNIKIPGRIKLEDIARNASLAEQGAKLAAANPILRTGRAAIEDGGYRRGFDIGCAAANGQTQNGPRKDAIRQSLQAINGGSNETVRGFDTALALQFGITKNGGNAVSQDPSFAAGQLATVGIAGSGMAPDQKSGAIQTVMTTGSGAQAGVATTIPKVQKGFFTKVLEFFGLA